MLRRGVIALACCAAAAAGNALAAPTGHLLGTVNGKTTQTGGKVSVTFDATRARLYNASGTFRCPANPAHAYEFASAGLTLRAQPRFHLGRPFTFKLSARWKATAQNPSQVPVYEPGKVRVTITGTVKVRKAPPSNSPGQGIVTGHGDVTFTAPGCSTGRLTWSGTGPLHRF